MVNRPDEMTNRARAYLAIASIRHLLMGGFALFAPGSFRSTSFLPILHTAPLWFWSLLFLGAGGSCGIAAITRREDAARAGMSFSATSTLIIGTSLLIAAFTGHLTSPTGPIIWLAVAFKDFVVCAQPIRSPFEALARYLEPEHKDSGDER